MRADAVRAWAAAMLLWLGCGLCQSSVAGVAAAPTDAASGVDDPRAWLARTDQALATRNYRGVFVHEYAGETEILRIVHRAGPDGLYERLQSLDGSGREFIRRGNQLFCYLPDRRMVLVEHGPDAGSLMTGLPNVPATLAGQYEVRQLARTRVSGRIARVIAIEPMDQLRYGYRVWIDEATAMPLKMQLRERRGRVLEQIVFTSLELPAHIAASELAPSIDARGYRWVDQQDVAASAAPGLGISWQAGALPPGFHMTAAARQMMPGGVAEHLVFSDGLASVSVFVQPAGQGGQQSSSDDTASLGTSSAYSTLIPGYRVTVVGEVPPATVRAVAEAIRSAGPPLGADGAFAAGASAQPAAGFPGPLAPLTAPLTMGPGDSGLRIPVPSLGFEGARAAWDGAGHRR